MKPLPAIAILALTLSAAPAMADDAPQVQFRHGGASDWIPYQTATATGIFFRARVNGRDALVLLYGGPTSIDRTFVPGAGAASPPTGVTVEAGGLTLRNVAADKIDPPEQLSHLAGAPISLLLGENVFDRLVVDIDSANHRLAFRDSASVVKPKDSVEVPLIDQDGERVLPLSLDGAPPALFEMQLGNMSGPLLVTPGYAEAHHLLENRAVSQRLSGKFIEKVVTLDRLDFAGIGVSRVPIAIVPDAALPPPSIAGGVGWPLLSRFHLVIDYPHNRLYAAANADAASAPMFKDRLGLVLARHDDAVTVTFVSPGSPAEAAGFKIGDEIAAIDGTPVKDMDYPAVATLRFADAGRSFAFTLKDGSTRQAKAGDFF